MTFDYYHTKARKYDVLFESPLDVAEDRGMMVYAGVAERVLDLGCGTALYMDYLRYGCKYVGIDISPGMLDVARHKHSHKSWARFMQGDIQEKLPFDDDSFDLVVSTSFSMSHCFKHDLLPGETARVLRPGGRAFFVYIGQRGFDWPHMWDYLGVPGDEAYRYWSVNELRREYHPYYESVKVVGFNSFANDLFRGRRFSERFFVSLPHDRVQVDRHFVPVFRNILFRLIGESMPKHILDETVFVSGRLWVAC